MGVAKAWFWGGWSAALALTALLLVWHLPFAPFRTPGARANEAAVIFLLAMAVRWSVVAGLVVAVARLQAAGWGLRGWAAAGLLLGLLALHLLLGVVNLGVWNAWLSVGFPHTRTGDTLLAATYF